MNFQWRNGRFSLRGIAFLLTSSFIVTFFGVYPAHAVACIQGTNYTYLSAANASTVIVKFTNTADCDFTLPTGLTSLSEVVVVGAGGGGGTDGGSGGGGGEARTTTNYLLNGVTSLRIAVGVGGNGGIWGGGGGTSRGAGPGTDSYIRKTDNTNLFLAKGGGAGNGWGSGSASAGGAAGSGGSGGTGTDGQVGGAGAAGCTNTGVTLGGSPTGALFSTSITGSPVDFGGGGGGGNATNVWNSSLRVNGRAGGGTSGGQGANYGKSLSGVDIQGTSRGAPGRANSGGGGGGGTACDSYAAYGSTFTSAVTVDGVTYSIGTVVDGSTQRTNGGQGADGVVIISFARVSPSFSAWGNITKTFGDAPYSVTQPTVTGSIAGSFSYASDTSAVISVSGNSLTVVGGGTAIITATFSPSDSTNYSTATVSHTVTVNKANQNLVFSTTSYSKAYNETQNVLAAAPGIGTISYSAGSSTACSVNPSTGVVTITSSNGTCTISAAITSDKNYNSANSSNSVSISVSQAISTTNVTLAVGNIVYRTIKNLTATSNTAGKMTFKANNAFIPGCRNLQATSGNSYTVTCPYRPSTRGFVILTVTFQPSNSGYVGSSASSGKLFILNRSGTR